MKNILKIFILFLFLFPFGCVGTKKTKQIPIVQVEKTVVKDSLIYIRDTLYLPLPVEEKEVKTTADSSHLETSIAESDAWIDSIGQLNHTLKNKDTVYKYIYDTVYINKTITEYKEKEVPIEVPIEVSYIPKWAWFCIIIAAVSVGWMVFKISLKFGGFI